MKENQENKNDKQPSYYAVIPSKILHDKRLSHIQIVLYGHISTMTHMKGYCWATNNKLAELLNVSKATVSRNITMLKRFGYLNVVAMNLPGKNNWEERRIYINDLTPIVTDDYTPIVTDDYTPIVTDDYTPIVISDTDNSKISNNIKSNSKISNTNNTQEPETPKHKTQEDTFEQVQTVGIKPDFSMFDTNELFKTIEQDIQLDKTSILNKLISLWPRVVSAKDKKAFNTLDIANQRLLLKNSSRYLKLFEKQTYPYGLAKCIEDNGYTEEYLSSKETQAVDKNFKNNTTHNFTGKY